MERSPEFDDEDRVVTFITVQSDDENETDASSDDLGLGIEFGEEEITFNSADGGFDVMDNSASGGEVIGAGKDKRVVNNKSEFHLKDSKMKERFGTLTDYAPTVMSVVDKYGLKQPYWDALYALADRLSIEKYEEYDYELLVSKISDELPETLEINDVPPPEYAQIFKKRDQTQAEYEQSIKKDVIAFEKYYIALAKEVYDIIEHI